MGRVGGVWDRVGGGGGGCGLEGRGLEWGFMDVGKGLGVYGQGKGT